jgi:hypothetical protein
MSYVAKYVIYKVKLLLLHLVVETSSHVAPHVQVSGAYPVQSRSDPVNI